MDGKSIDLTFLSNQHYQTSGLKQAHDELDGRSGGHPQINCENLKLEILPDIKWTPTAPQAQHAGPTRKVKVENKTEGADVFGNLQTSKESDMHVKITLSTGMVKGLNKLTRLPLPKEIQSKLGTNIKFDPSKPESGVPDKMNISVTSGHDIPAGSGAATATVTCKEEEYEGRFECQARMEGDVIIKSPGGSSCAANVTEVLRYVPGVKINGEYAIWKMAGSCALRWEFEQTVTWN